MGYVLYKLQSLPVVNNSSGEDSDVGDGVDTGDSQVCKRSPGDMDPSSTQDKGSTYNFFLHLRAVGTIPITANMSSAYVWSSWHNNHAMKRYNRGYRDRNHTHTPNTHVLCNPVIWWWLGEP